MLTILRKKQTKKLRSEFGLNFKKKVYPVKKTGRGKIYKNSRYFHEAELWDIYFILFLPVPFFSPFIASSPPLNTFFLFKILLFAKFSDTEKYYY